jgi:hypothetical protein
MTHISCVACGSVDDVHHHPLVGGSVEPWNLITLCDGCRAKLMASSVTPKRRRPPRRFPVLVAGAATKR